MAVPTTFQFLERFPELSPTPTRVIEIALEAAGRECSEEVWGARHGDGCGYYAAHLIALRVRQVGASVNQPVAGPSGGSGINSTFYGQQYEDLLRTLPLTGFAV